MNKSKMAVITCFVIVIFTMLSPISVFEKYKINAMTFIEDEQINIINKTSKLSNQETKLIFMDIKNRLINKYDNFELKNFRAIFVDADNNPNYVDFDVIADMSSECIPTETEYYKGMLEAANNLTSLLDRDIAQILITDNYRAIFRLSDCFPVCHHCNINKYVFIFLSLIAKSNSKII